MAFPLPDPSTSESNDAQRDERKRQASPPSSFYAQSQAILTAIRYVEPLHSGYPGSATKHKNRTRGALLVQLLAAFEYTLKDFIAQVLDVTHIYDDEVKNWDWMKKLDMSTVLASREGRTRLGAVLVHPLLGWQSPETLNDRYRDVFRRELIRANEAQPLRDLWIIRHSIAHNGGFVTEPDARRLRTPSLAERQVQIDLAYLEEATRFLRAIVCRLETEIGPSLLTTWFGAAAARTWDQDQLEYTRVKLITTFVQSRPRELPEVDEAMYQADLAAYG